MSQLFEIYFALKHHIAINRIDWYMRKKTTFKFHLIA